VTEVGDHPGRPVASPRWIDVLLVVVLAVAAHAPALHGTTVDRTGYTIDDHTIVEQNARLVIERPADLVALVTSSYWGEDYREERLWRPVVLLSFALDRALFGPDPDAYHRVSVGLHALTSALALLLCWRLLPRRAALTAALLFAVHPVHAEATAGLVGRAEVLGLAFALAGMLLHLRARDLAASSGWLRGALRFVPPALSFLLGFAAKEAALTAPFILVVVERVAGAPRPAGRARRYAPYALHALVIAAYFGARALVLGGVLPTAETQSIGSLSLGTRALVAALVSRDAIRAVLAPAPTSALYPFEPPLPGSAVFAPALVAVVVHLALLAFAVTLLVQGRRRSRLGATLGLGALAFYMSLGPTSNLIPIGVIFAERLLYTPSLWAIIAVTAALVPVLRLSRGLWVVCLALALGACALRLGENARAWTDDARLWGATLARFRDEPVTRMAKAHESYARALLARGRIEAALPHVVKAVEGAPTSGVNAAAARALLGSVFHEQGRLEEALAVLEEARALAPSHAATLAELASVQLAIADAAPPDRRPGLLARAERTAREGTRAAPQSYWLWLYWGTILSRLDGRELDAERAYDRAIERRAAPWEALANRALIREARGALALALDDDRRACAILLARPLPSDDAVRTLPLIMLHRAALSTRLGQPDAEARAWLAAHRPDLLRRLDAPPR
jgi:tetratricopeptide (TPR) repeat protein